MAEDFVKRLREKEKTQRMLVEAIDDLGKEKRRIKIMILRFFGAFVVSCAAIYFFFDSFIPSLGPLWAEVKNSISGMMEIQISTPKQPVKQWFAEDSKKHPPAPTAPSPGAQPQPQPSDASAMAKPVPPPQETQMAANPPPTNVAPTPAPPPLIDLSTQKMPLASAPPPPPKAVQPAIEIVAPEDVAPPLYSGPLEQLPTLPTIPLQVMQQNATVFTPAESTQEKLAEDLAPKALITQVPIPRTEFTELSKVDTKRIPTLPTKFRAPASTDYQATEQPPGALQGFENKGSIK
jgi:hypothetical protein